MLATDVGTLVYNHIQHGIYLRIELYPNFDRQGEYQPTDKMGFTFHDTKNILFYTIYFEYFWYLGK